MDSDLIDGSGFQEPDDLSVSRLLAAWGAQLAAAGVPSPGHDARTLAAHVLEVRPGELFLLSRFDSDDVKLIEELVRRRATREPLQYLTGSVGFLGLDLHVGPGVFVPRPETELMADHVVKYLRAGGRDHALARRGDSLLRGQGDRLLTGGNDHLTSGDRNSPSGPEANSGYLPAVSRHAEAREPSPSALDPDGMILVVDLCTGSGALGLAIAANVASVACVGVEASPSASDYARRNSAECGDQLAALDSSFVIVDADATSVAHAELSHLQGTVDVVVCNPPYVPDDALPREAEVRDFDPAQALYGGPDGLDVVRQLVDTAAKLLRPGGLVAMEHADSQGESAGAAGVPGILRYHRLILDDSGRSEPAYQNVADNRDLNGRPRFTTATRRDPRLR